MSSLLVAQFLYLSPSSALPMNICLANSESKDNKWMSDPGPSVWTGRALQAENDDLEKVGLALLYPAY